MRTSLRERDHLGMIRTIYVCNHTHTDIGFNLMKRAVADLAGMGHPDADPKLIGRNIHVMLTEPVP